jgi:hypothetical protein
MPAVGWVAFGVVALICLLAILDYRHICHRDEIDSQNRHRVGVRGGRSQ